MRSAITIVVSSFLLLGCAPKLLKHYNTKADNRKTEPSLELSVFVAPIKPPAENAPLLGLSERGQAEFIKAVNARLPSAATAADFTSAVTKAPEEPAGECAWADKSVISKQFQITLLGDLVLPADRVERLRLDLELADKEKFSFSSWDRFDSQYVSYNFGTAKYTQTGKLTAGLSATLTKNKEDDKGSSVFSPSISGDFSNSLEEAATYASRKLTIGGALSPHRATLVQEGGPNTNLFGTAAAKISIRLTSTKHNAWTYRVKLPKKLDTPSNEAEVLRCQAKVLDRAKELVLDVNGLAQLRSVRDRGDSVSEGDDVAEYSDIPLSVSPLTLATEEEMTFRTFGLCRQVTNTRGEELSCNPITIDEQDVQAGNFVPLEFSSITEANTFRQWLIRQSTSAAVSEVGGRALRGGTGKKSGITSRDASELVVRRAFTNGT